MNSPFTDGSATLKHEKRQIEYRKETFEYVALYYECDDTKETFTTTELDGINLSQIYNQYRERHSIPFTDEIVGLRSKYRLSIPKMAKILGLPVKDYRQYEEGYVPTEANGKLLSTCMQAFVFEGFVKKSEDVLSAKEFNSILSLISEQKTKEKDCELKQSLVFGKGKRGATNGFAIQSVEKLKNVLLYFTQNCRDVFNTKMNKLLFYLDFYNYRRTGYSVTGLTYKAIQYGPVPERWDKVYSVFDEIEQDTIEFPNGVTGTRLTSSVPPNLDLFSDEEKNSLRTIAEKFCNTSSSDISKISHQEDAWRLYENTQTQISFDTAWDMKGI